MRTPHTGRSPGRNDPCPCGSGKKYKKCHGANDAAGRPASAAPATGGDVEQQFAQAYHRFQQGMFASAAEICAAVLRTQPNHVHANHLLGLCHYQQGHFEAALPHLDRAVKLDPSDPDAQSNLARTLGRVGRLDDAESHARRAMKLDPKSATPGAVLGKILVDLRRLPEAEEVLRQALSLDGRNADAWSTLGELCRTERRLAEAKEAYERVLSLTPDSLPALNDLGLVLKELKDYDGALRCFQRARELVPADADVLCNLGSLAIARGDIEAARDMFEQALAVNNHYALAYMNLFGLATQQGDWNEGVRWLLRGVAMCPDNPAFHEQLAVAYAEQQEFPRANEQVEQAAKIGGETASTELARAEVYDRHHNREAASAAFGRAVELDPYNPELLLKFADFEEQSNRLDDAVDLATRVLELDPSREAEVRILMARAERRRREYDRAEDELGKLDFDRLPTGLRAQAWYELGALRDVRGEYAQAFDAYSKGAHAVISSGSLQFDPEQTAASMQHDREVLQPNVLKQLARFKGELGSKSTPIFIVGFMRSGTTLVEQILSSHPQVQAGDELLALQKLAEVVAGEVDGEFPDCLTGLGGSDAQELLAKWRERYLGFARDAGVDVEREGYFTDKMPLNLLKLPLITMLFPDSPILHIRRNPMDCVFSNFVTNLSSVSPWAYNLEHAARYYRDVLTLAEHYRAHLPMRYLELRYEDLVANPEEKIREIAEFVGLPWDDSMIRFHENKRVARTPSHAQVNQPMYTRSVERYRNYEEFLAEPLEILEPLMRRYGYLVKEN